MANCDDRDHIHPAPAVPCHTNREQCLDHDFQHRKGEEDDAYEVCDTCWIGGRRHREPLERNFLNSEVMQGPTNWTYNPNEVLTLLCKHCEDDEIALCNQRIATGAVDSGREENFPYNTCVCYEDELNTNRYCLNCRQLQLFQMTNRVRTGHARLRVMARNRAGRCVAHPTLQIRRAVDNRRLACRCGRTTAKPSQSRVMMCLSCQGVRVNRKLRGYSLRGRHLRRLEWISRQNSETDIRYQDDRNGAVMRRCAT